LTDEAPPLDPELLGPVRRHGADRAHLRAAGRRGPPRILLFKRNLERFARDEASSSGRSRARCITSWRTILGFAEDDMAELDLD
jgi:hypothetical protein